MPAYYDGNNNGTGITPLPNHSFQFIEYTQPYEIKTKVSDKLNAKGESQPEIEITISRKLGSNEQVYTIIDTDIQNLKKKVKETMNFFRGV